jgi:hypothetical protein
MSQQAVYDVDFKDEKLLLEALNEMGYNPTVHKEAVALKTYGSQKGVKAHIVISKAQGNFRYADLGFERTKEGFKLHADHIDINKLNLSQLKQTYTKAFIKKKIRSMGTKYIMGKDELDQDGTMKLKVKVMV